VWLSLAGPAVRGFVLKMGKKGTDTRVTAKHDAVFNWRYGRDHAELARLYAAAKTSQWNADDLPWETTVDPHDRERELISDEILPMLAIPQYRSLPAREQEKQRHGMLAWLLSQSLHGEQGALLAACQVTEAVQWM